MTLFWPMKKVIVKIKLFCVIFVQTGSSYWQIWCHLPNAFVPFNTAPSVWRPLWLCLKPSSSTVLEAFQTIPDIIWYLHANKIALATFHERTTNAMTISTFLVNPETFNEQPNNLDMIKFDVMVWTLLFRSAALCFQYIRSGTSSWPLHRFAFS